MKKPTKATAGERHAQAIAHDLRFGPGEYQSRIDRATRRIDTAIRRAVNAERERCRKIVSLSASDAREMGDRSDSFGACERCILNGKFQTHHQYAIRYPSNAARVEKPTK